MRRLSSSAIARPHIGREVQCAILSKRKRTGTFQCYFRKYFPKRFGQINFNFEFSLLAPDSRYLQRAALDVCRVISDRFECHVSCTIIFYDMENWRKPLVILLPCSISSDNNIYIFIYSSVFSPSAARSYRPRFLYVFKPWQFRDCRENRLRSQAVNGQ